ncbi:MAG: protein SanA [Flavobacteriaceae bacterium]|nr:MAG: protein SanA [Flavobacteriaceae bacterium]
MKKIKYLAILGLLIFSISLANFFYMNRATENLLYNSVDEIPFRTYGVVLGTSKYMVGGGINRYYENRIIAANALYKAGKIKYILVSGDNMVKSYNEPKQMKASLVELGIPSDKIFEDFAGRRTLDSVIRANQVFGLDTFTLISQEFHNVRGTFLAKEKGIDVIGFNAEDVKTSRMKIKNLSREMLARVKARLDLIFGVAPEVLGNKISLPH